MSLENEDSTEKRYEEYLRYAREAAQKDHQRFLQAEFKVRLYLTFLGAVLALITFIGFDELVSLLAIAADPSTSATVADYTFGGVALSFIVSSIYALLHFLYAVSITENPTLDLRDYIPDHFKQKAYLEVLEENADQYIDMAKGIRKNANLKFHHINIGLFFLWVAVLTAIATVVMYLVITV